MQYLWNNLFKFMLKHLNIISYTNNKTEQSPAFSNRSFTLARLSSNFIGLLRNGCLLKMSTNPISTFERWQLGHFIEILYSYANYPAYTEGRKRFEKFASRRYVPRKIPIA